MPEIKDRFIGRKGIDSARKLVIEDGPLGGLGH
jgi:hypothetical protein